MITISCCSIGFREELIEAIIPRLARIGYDAVEIWGNHIDGKSDSELRDIRALAAQHKLKIEVISPYFWLTQNQKLLEKSMGIAERFVHYAQVLGCPKIRTFTDAGPTGIGSDVATPEHWATAIRALKTITALDRNILFVVEIHEKTLADTAESTMRLLDAVGAPNLKILYHPAPATILKNYELLKTNIRHMHLINQDAAGKATWFESGVMDYPALFKTLVQDGYAHSVSVEYCWQNLPWDRAESAYKYLARYLKSP